MLQQKIMVVTEKCNFQNEDFGHNSRTYMTHYSTASQTFKYMKDMTNVVSSYSVRILL